MKKLILFAALMWAAVAGANAQATTEPMPTDSVSVMFRHLAHTNAEIVRINKAYTMHAAMVGVGGAMMLTGSLLSLQGASQVELGDDAGVKLAKAGSWMSVVGVAFIAASFIPLPRSVHVDGRGLVVDLPTK